MIGFATACSSFSSGILRMSWREDIQEDKLDYVEIAFKQCLAKSGGAKP